MMRIAYISRVEEQQIPKAKKQSAKDIFLTEVSEAIASRRYFDEKRANELFHNETSELEKLQLTLKKLKQTRDEML